MPTHMQEQVQNAHAQQLNTKYAVRMTQIPLCVSSDGHYGLKLLNNHSFQWFITCNYYQICKACERSITWVRKWRLKCDTDQWWTPYKKKTWGQRMLLMKLHLQAEWANNKSSAAAGVTWETVAQRHTNIGSASCFWWCMGKRHITFPPCNQDSI